VGAHQENRAVYFLETLVPTHGTTITAGARLEWFGIDATDAFDPAAPNPSFINGGSPQGEQNERQHALELGVRQELNESWSAFARGTRAFRFATVDELYEGSASFAQEFQFLRPQTSETYELGVDWRREFCSARLGMFQTDLKDEIHLDPFSFGTGNTNLPASRRQGIEAEFGARPTARIDLRLAYTYTEAEFREGTIGGGTTGIAGKTVPLVARNRVSVNAGLRVTDRLLLDGVWNYVGSQFMENDEENGFGAKIPSYSTTDVRLAYEMRRASLSLTVNNLFDEEYYNYAVTSIFTPGRFSAYPLPGRSAFLALKLFFGD
jgi:iron complex outermembrane receptor protein